MDMDMDGNYEFERGDESTRAIEGSLMEGVWLVDGKLE